MQNPDDQDCADKHQDTVSIYGDVADVSFHGIAPLDGGSWEGSHGLWPPGSFTSEQQIPGHYGYSGEPWPLLETGDTNQHNVTCFHIPTAEWPSELALDMAGGKLGSRTAPTTATQYNLAPQNSSLEPENGSTGAGKKAMSSTSSVSPGDTPVTKRRRVQNKLAAARCRRKAKHGEDELQRREKDLLRENRILNVHASLLREEVLQLKHEILRHSQCDTGHIHRYIQRTAEQLGGS